MAVDGAFGVNGPTVLVTTSAVQVPSSPQGPSYRVRCLISGYLTWGTSAAVTAAGAPAAGAPVAQTFGMTAGTVETFALSPNLFFISSIANGFEVTPGEGL